ncbi:hypothetical protein GCM10007913_28820 [Devosia yakushimensis]|uniref:Uncharacterized protein n=1 Tax=Devosia yakushimensis TaxID=470028 RepID=A0ABQ5UFS4_9HYPH|nr:hypothetical protein GCM10007913_28820 [Devosia yakushimensis]
MRVGVVQLLLKCTNDPLPGPPLKAEGGTARASGLSAREGVIKATPSANHKRAYMIAD